MRNNRRGGKSHSGDVRLVRMDSGSRGFTRRKSRIDRIIKILMCCIAVLAAVCIGVTAYVFSSRQESTMGDGGEQGGQVAQNNLQGTPAPGDGTGTSSQDGNGFLAPDVTAEPTPDPAEEELLIVIDPGHGGWDNGCSRDGVLEKDVNLAISLMVVEKLQDKGYETMLIREDNETGIDKRDRVEVAKEAGAGVYVSIHQNSYGEEGKDNSVTGVETYYATTNEDSVTLAQLVQTYVAKNTGARDRGIINNQSLVVIRENECPSCLVETGFLTNAKERQSLTTEEYQDKIASGIVQGIDEFVESLKKAN